MGVTRNGSLFLTREGHALVAGEEEAIEFEMWVNGSCRSQGPTYADAYFLAIEPGAVLGS